MQCLDDNLVSAYLAHRLSSSEEQQVVDHLSSCDLCLTIACASVPEEAAPRTLGRYQILAELERGTFVAHDPQLGRDVMLRIGAATVVRHPNVIPVLATTELAGEPVVAFDLFGEPLSAWIATRPASDVTRACIAAGRGFVALDRPFAPDDAFVDAAGRVAVAPVGGAAARPLGDVVQLPRRIRRAPLPAQLDHLERPRSLRGPIIVAAILASVAVVAIAWPAKRPPRGPDPVADVIAKLERTRLAARTELALMQGRYQDALALARSSGDRRALVLAELGTDQLSDVIRDGSSLVAQSASPPADAVCALIAAHALLGHRELAAGTLDRLADRTGMAAALAAYYQDRRRGPLVAFVLGR